jgi:hypothetical protein
VVCALDEGLALALSIFCVFIAYAGTGRSTLSVNTSSLRASKSPVSRRGRNPDQLFVMLTITRLVGQTYH